MTDQDPVIRIQKELTAFKAEEVRADNELRYKNQSGMAVYDLLQDVERIRKRRVELEVALKILEERK